MFSSWCAQSLAGQGKLQQPVVPSSLHPPPPCQFAAVQPKLPGIERLIALSDILPSVHMLLCPSYLQLLQPSTPKMWPKSAVELILCISCSFQIYNKIKSHHPYLHEICAIWKLFHIHLLLLMANANAKPRAIYHVALH